MRPSQMLRHGTELLPSIRYHLVTGSSHPGRVLPALAYEPGHWSPWSGIPLERVLTSSMRAFLEHNSSVEVRLRTEAHSSAFKQLSQQKRSAWR